VRIIHLHLHENFGDRDSHLPLFTGPSRNNPAGLAGFVERLHRRAYDGCAILEQWPQPASLLVDARNRLNELILKSTPRPSNSQP
jgi:sugar phosphate isomerase/epimerase